MKEQFLHFIWENRLFRPSHLKTTQKQPLTILSFGNINKNQGVDIQNAKINLGNQVWVGNIEIHINSSDWYKHNHHLDENFSNIVLHVVWEHDIDVFYKDQTLVPTLELKNLVDSRLYNRIKSFYEINYNFIICENELPNITIKNDWFEKLYYNRIANKTIEIQNLLYKTKNDWEAVLFNLLAKSFGLNVNNDSFYDIASSIPFSIFRKCQNILQFEALLYGQGQLLNGSFPSKYYISLQSEYTYLCKKFSISNSIITAPKFSRLRPPNFPTIRLSQLANLYFSNQSLFSRIIETQTKKDLYTLLTTRASAFWDTHYTFKSKTQSKKSIKYTTTKFIDLIIINTIIPIKFAFSRSSYEKEKSLAILKTLSAEKNTIISSFNTLKINPQSALESQALIQLYNYYCQKKDCLNCNVGKKIIAT